MLRLLLALLGWVLIAGAQPFPPAMSKRAIAPSNNLAGVQVALNDQGTNFTLFLPDGWMDGQTIDTLVNIHFHTVAWFAIQEHARRAAKEPQLIFALGERSSTYRTAFEDTNRFGRVLALTENELRRRSGRVNLRIAAVDISSFSAGYGAVRELVKSPAYFKLLRRVALLDSFYAGLEPQRRGSTGRVPVADQIEVWMPLARAAARGEKTFVITHSQVPTASYASTFECAAALLDRVGMKPQAVPLNSIPAANDPDFPLLTRADMNGFHVWGYAGTDAQAHLTHVRHLADVWQAINTGGGPSGPLIEKQAGGGSNAVAPPVQ